MKKLVLLVSLLALAAAPAFANDNQTINTARQAVNECINNAKQAGYVDVTATINVTGICFVSGETKQVVFMATAKCPDSRLCKLVPVQVATVDLGCDDEVITTSCNFMTK